MPVMVWYVKKVDKHPFVRLFVCFIGLRAAKL